MLNSNNFNIKVDVERMKLDLNIALPITIAEQIKGVIKMKINKEIHEYSDIRRLFRPS